MRRLAPLLLLLLPAAPAQAAEPNIAGLWRNPDRSVIVQVQSCGEEICGTVVSATAEAQTDAREGGYPKLIGLNIFHRYRRAGRSRWIGRVLVPDLGHEFSSHIDLIDSAHARVAGCLFGQHLCMTQIWQRD